MKRYYSKIIITTLVIVLLLAIISYIISKDRNIALGFIVGSIARITGFIATIITSKRLIQSSRPKTTALSFYIQRYIFYGIVIAIAISRGINVITLIVGFLPLTLAIYLYRKEEI